jgi:hypothetical protein
MTDNACMTIPRQVVPGRARFYKKLGFTRVARLPDLIADERTEILWRKPRPAPSRTIPVRLTSREAAMTG